MKTTEHRTTEELDLGIDDLETLDALRWGHVNWGDFGAGASIGIALVGLWVVAT